MAMAWIWTGMAVVSVVCGAVYGRMEAVSAAALEGAGQAVRLCLSMAGMLCLWTGLMEVMDRCGLSRRLGRLFRPVLRRLLPQASRDPETLAAVTANVSANLLGLGNAATPMGIRAACRMARGTEGVASDELCRLVVLNTASIQLLPTTVASIRAVCGSAAPLDILPAVWVSSLLSVAAGLAADMTDWVIPCLLAGVAAAAMGRRTDVYGALTDGAAEGLRVLGRILPALVVLLSAVQMFRASGAMELLTGLLSPVLEGLGIPPETVVLLLVRPVSGSGALAVGSQLMEQYGPDSYIGRVTAVMLGCSETTFYTVAVYYGAAGIRRTRHTIPAALAADAAAFIAAAWAVRVFFP